MIDVHLPTTDGHQLILSRYTEPDKDQQLLLQQRRPKIFHKVAAHLQKISLLYCFIEII
jgi:hypothetical protein